MHLALSDIPDRGMFEAIFAALDRDSMATAGPATPRLLAIPIRGGAGEAIGGLWGVSIHGWLQLEMLLVPGPMRGQGVGARLMAMAEKEARTRGCLGIYVDTFSFQAAPFYEKMGFIQFGALHDCPPGHSRLFFQKRLSPV